MTPTTADQTWRIAQRLRGYGMLDARRDAVWGDAPAFLNDVADLLLAQQAECARLQQQVQELQKELLARGQSVPGVGQGDLSRRETERLRTGSGS